MMKQILAGFSAAAILFAANSAYAGGLSGSEIKTRIAGKRVLLETGYGIDFPLYYAANGRVTGDGRGTGLGKYFAPKETGNWWIKGDRMCQKFPTWYKGKTLCFRLQDGGQNKLIWKRQDGKSGVARIS